MIIALKSLRDYFQAELPGMIIAWVVVIWACLSMAALYLAFTGMEWQTRYLAMDGFLGLILAMLLLFARVMRDCPPGFNGDTSIWWNLAGWRKKNNRFGR